MYREFEDMDFGDDDFSQAEYSCPFCADDFDAVGLCCHIDEDHPVEVKNGVLCFHHLFYFFELIPSIIV